jgi:endo-1,4-beta-xylanase
MTPTDKVPAPEQLELRQNYPNPFKPNTMLSYTIPKASYVTVTVYDALGRQVETLFEGAQNSGSYNLEFDGAGLPSGTYVAVLRAGNESSTIRMTLSK